MNKQLFTKILAIAALAVASSAGWLLMSKETPSEGVKPILVGKWMSSPDFCSGRYSPDTLTVFELQPGSFVVNDTHVEQPMAQEKISISDVPDEVTALVGACDSLTLSWASGDIWHKLTLERFAGMSRDYYWYGTGNELPAMASGLLVTLHNQAPVIYEPFDLEKIKSGTAASKFGLP